MTVLLLDGYNLLFRSFTSVPASIKNRDGTSINGVYGLVSTILRLARELQHDHILCAFDVPGTPTFRHALYPAYQAQRGPLGGERAAEFVVQVELAETVLPTMGVPVLTFPGYEADDIIATLATNLEKARNEALVISTDRDLMQLIGPRVQMLLPSSKGVHIRDENDVRERLGVRPAGVITFKSLAGDSSDNIPGVRGVGAKTAIELTNRYGSLERIYQDLAVLPQRVGKALAGGQAEAFLFRRLVTLKRDLPLNLGADNFPKPTLNPKTTTREVLDRAGVERP